MKRSKTSENKSSFKMTQQLIEQYERELKEFEDWIKSKPHLPQNMGRYMLKLPDANHLCELINSGNVREHKLILKVAEKASSYQN